MTRKEIKKLEDRILEALDKQGITQATVQIVADTTGIKAQVVLRLAKLGKEDQFGVLKFPITDLEKHVTTAVEKMHRTLAPLLADGYAIRKFKGN